MHFTGDVMRAAGHHVDYVFTEDLGPVKVHRLRRYVVPYRVAKTVVSRHRQHGPYDVVEIHEPSAAVYIALHAWQSYLPPAVVISYGAESRCLAAWVNYSRRVKSPVAARHRITALSVAWLSDYALRHARQLICFSKEDYEYCRQLGVEADRITRTHSGVDPSFLAAGTRPRLNADEAPRILFLGSWVGRKGIREFAEATSKLFLEFPSARVTVAGCGCRADLVHAHYPPEHRSKVSVHTKVSSDAELQQIYARHSVFVLPSIFEGQPLSMLEAAAMRLAIITTRVSGMADFIDHDRNGILVRPGDSPALTQAMFSLVRTPGRARQLGEAAWTAVQSFTWTHTASEMLTAYAKASKARHRLGLRRLSDTA
jgi:glycosyltransferase involved in cell wall biosynthesis